MSDISQIGHWLTSEFLALGTIVASGIIGMAFATESTQPGNGKDPINQHKLQETLFQAAVETTTNQQHYEDRLEDVLCM